MVGRKGDTDDYLRGAHLRAWIPVVGREVMLVSIIEGSLMCSLMFSLMGSLTG